MATVMHVMQTTFATSVGSTPGSLAFAWDIFLKLPLITDWQAITHACELNLPMEWELSLNIFKKPSNNVCVSGVCPLQISLGCV